jgi:hypothetical protein
MDGSVVAPRFSIGRTLKDSLRIFARNFVALAFLAFVVRLLILVAPSDGKMLMSAGPPHFWNSIFAMSVENIVTSITETLVVFGTLQNLRGQRASIADWWRSIPFVPLTVLGGAILGLPSFASLITRNLFPGNTVVVGLGGIVFTIISLVLLLMWCIYAPATVIEKGGLLHGLRRSRYLLSGQRWRIFGLFVIAGVVSIAITLVTALIAGVGLTGLASVQTTSPAGIAIFVISALTLAFNGVLTTVSYYHLRVAKDGPITEDLVEVFD